MLPSTTLRHFLRAACALLIIVFALPLRAAENDYNQAFNGNWSLAGNWSLGVPAAGQDVVIGHHAISSDLQVFLDVSTPLLNSLTIDAQSTNGNFAIFNQNANFILNANSESLGTNASHNRYNQSAGTNTTPALGIGVAQGLTQNEYNLSGTGALNISTLLDIGISGAGAFNQSGGTVTLGNNAGFVLAFNPGSAGAYNLSGGTLTVPGQETVGYSGTASFTHTAGTNSSGSIIVAGSYTLSGTGILNVATQQNVGASVGSGTFTLNGGANTIAGTLTIGNTTGSFTGTYNLQSGSLSATTINLLPLGTFNQTGGSLTCTAFNQSGGTVSQNLINLTTYNYSGGAFNATLINRGVANFSASFTASNGILNDGGSFTLPALITLTLNGAGLDNEGAITLSGGSLDGSAPVLNNSLITGYGAITGSGGFTNNGLIAQGNGNIIFSKSGASTNKGNMILAPGRQLQFQSGITFTNSGSLSLNSAAITGQGTFFNTGGGSITGPGSILCAFSNVGTLSPAAADDSGTLNITSAWTNSGAILLSSTGSSITGGPISNGGLIRGLGSIGSGGAGVTNNGSIEPYGGILIVGGLFTNSPAGIIRISTGNQLLIIQGLSTNSGIISLTGGTFDNNNQLLNNAGQISGFGTLATGGLTNSSSMTFAGGLSTINGDLTNTLGHTINIKFNPAIFTGNVTNSAGATLKTTSTTATFAGTFTNNGSYLSDPAINIFQSDVSIGPAGLMTGSTGDEFHFIAGTVSNQGTFSNGGLLQSAASITNSGTFTQSGPQAWSPATFTNTGSATFGTNTGSATTAPLSILLNSGLITITAPQHLNSLTLAGTSNDWSGKLDVTNQSMIIVNNTANTPNQIKQAAHLGAWNGPAGITSSNAQAAATGSTATGLAYATGAQFIANNGQTTFNGMNFSPTDMLVMYTLAGDANMDKYVTFADFLQLQNHYNQAGTDWQGGDFNYDGSTTFADFLILQNNYNKTLQPGNLIAAETSSTVPESSSLALLALGIATLIRRKTSRPHL